MGRRRTLDEQMETIRWGRGFRVTSRALASLRFGDLKSTFIEELKEYFALAGLSRSTTAPATLVSEAWGLVFGVRVKLERSLLKSIESKVKADPLSAAALFAGSFFGASKKQGVSVRFALSSCQPTKLCGAACYAHDVLDASPAAVVRGAINSWIAAAYERNFFDEDTFNSLIEPHCKRAIAAAIDEAPSILSEWRRKAYIRFSHVGEIAEYPNFANYLAGKIHELSAGKISCVVYTRHSKSSLLDPRLFVVNFTLDEASNQRASWKPDTARLVYSAFGGRISSDAAVNFLEHHRWTHLAPVGTGKVCPTTLPETTERSCDAVRCDLCFRHPENKAPINVGTELKAKTWR